MTTVCDQGSFKGQHAAIFRTCKMFAAPAEMFEPILWDTVNLFPLKMADLGKIFSKLVSTKNSHQPIISRFILKNGSNKIPKFH